MPLTVTYKIGKKPRGNWRTPLEFNIKIEGPELALRPELVFEREYPLPGKIYLGQTHGIPRKGGRSCKVFDKIGIKINTYIDDTYERELQRVLCRSFCSSCSLCRVYLPWRPGRPDYSDFEEVFRQVAQDLAEAWNRAVEEAATSEEYESVVSISSDDILSQPAVAALPSRTRRIRIA